MSTSRNANGSEIDCKRRSECKFCYRAGSSWNLDANAPGRDISST